MERGLLNLINHGNWKRFSHFIFCLTEAGSFAECIEAPECQILELRKGEGNDFRIPIRIARVARERGVDILHARGWPTLLESALAARMAGIRHTVYGFHGKTIQDLKGIGLRRRLLQRVGIRCYDQVVTLNRTMQRDLVREAKLHEDRIRVIANGVDLHSFRPMGRQTELRREFGLPENRFVVGSVGRLDPVKNHKVLLRALARSSATGRFVLLIVGEGPYRSTLEDEVERLGLGDDVRFFGYSDRIPELMNCMDVYVQSSLYEGFSNTILEAMACGVPVVVTDVGGTADFVNEGRHGWLFNPDDDETLSAHLHRLKTYSDQRKLMGERAREHVCRQYSVQTMVRRYEELYLELARS